MTNKNHKPGIRVNQHPEGGWQTKKEGNERASGRFDIKQDAVDAAIQQAKREGTEVVVQGRDGKIQSKDSYGKDPNPPKDKEH
jgi:Uncharacterized protein conserved in bacteria (DUF2188)